MVQVLFLINHKNDNFVKKEKNALLQNMNLLSIVITWNTMTMGIEINKLIS